MVQQAFDPTEVLSDEALIAHFGYPTFDRGEAYFEDGRVQQLQAFPTQPGSMSVFARVDGSRGHAYIVTVKLQNPPRDEQLWPAAPIATHCTCPVVDRCKHGVAVALALRAASAPTRRPGWERQLDAVLSELGETPKVGSGDRRLALEFRLRQPRYHRGGRPLIHVRALQEGTGKPWIKTGIRWAEVPRALSRFDHDQPQLLAISHLHAALVTGGSWWSNIDDPDLEHFGSRVWALLADAVGAGVTLLVGGELGAVDLAPEPLEVTAEVTGADEGLTLRTGVRHGDAMAYGDNLLLIGRPPHGVVLVSEEPPEGRRRKPRTLITLGSLTKPVPTETARLLQSTEPIIIPAAEVEELTGSYLPRLARHLRVRSPDGSVEVPEAIAPRLAVVVTWSGVAAQTRWEWHYAKERIALDAIGSLGGLRDRFAEQSAWSRLRDEGVLDAFATIALHSSSTHQWEGPDAVELAAAVLPPLHDHPDIDVLESDEPDFREAVGDVEISFDAASTPQSEDDSSQSTDWLGLTVTIQVDGERVPLADVLGALTLGQERLLLPSGLHLSVDRPEFHDLADLVAAASQLGEVDADTVSVGRHDLGLWAQLADLGIVDAQAAEWVHQAQALRDLTQLPQPDPTGVVSTMRSYQLDGFWWLAFLWQHGLGGILADDMGLGKTLQVLGLISHARSQGSERFLVVAPTSVVSAWQTEAARHTPGLRIAAVTASAARRGHSIAELAADADVVVTTYTLLRLEPDAYAEVEWGGLILDEAQQVKNHQGKTYQAVRRLPVPWKLAVTGTPFENRLMELWSLLSITCPGLYPWPAKFAEHVVKPVEKDGDAAALRRFRQRIRPFLLRRTKELVAADLPPKQEQVLEVGLSPRHRKIYDTHLQKERQKILGLVGDFNRNRVAIFSSLTRMRQLALDPGLVDDDHAAVGSAKLDALVEHLTEIAAEGHRALVFSQFTTFLTLARSRLEAAGVTTTYLDGRTRHRAEVIEEFKSGAADAFLISLKAGGVGLTLTEADYVFVLDPWWNPAAEAQAVDRAHRIGQTRPVLVYRLVATDTIEEKVMALKARKAELFAQVIDGDGAMSTSITADDVRALFD